MFQKILTLNAHKWPLLPLNASDPAALWNKLEQKGYNRIDQGRRKDPLGGLIPMGIDIIGEQSDIQQQTRNGDGRDLVLIRPQKEEEIRHAVERVEFYKIVDDKADNGGYQAKQHPQPEVVFFENHDFHVFSSLLLRT